MEKIGNVGVCPKILMLQALIVGLERSWSARDEMASSSSPTGLGNEEEEKGVGFNLYPSKRGHWELFTAVARRSSVSSFQQHLHLSWGSSKYIKEMQSRSFTENDVSAISFPFTSAQG